MFSIPPLNITLLHVLYDKLKRCIGDTIKCLIIFFYYYSFFTIIFFIFIHSHIAQHNYARCSSDKHCLHVPLMLSTLGRCYFVFVAPTIWNDLPLRFVSLYLFPHSIQPLKRSCTVFFY